MILLLGNTGYMGQAFEEALRQRGWAFTTLSRKQLDYTRFKLLFPFLKEKKFEFVVNAAGYTGKPNVDACEQDWAGTLQGNTLFAATLAHACCALDIPFGHVSSGCIYSGAKVMENGVLKTERDLMHPDILDLLHKNPAIFHGFTESDTPNFTFRAKPCSFYSGTKALGEENMAGVGRNYIWRLRIPFDQFDNKRNYLSKVQNYPKVYQNVNSISHRADFVNACLDLWAKKAPFGTYNVVNPGFVTTSEVIDLIKQILKPNRTFEFWASDAEFYNKAAATPRSNCILDASKLLGAGVKMRPVREALIDSLEHWTKL
jgi:dTDP-4-dehydrorhamnose reductase